MTKKVKDDLEKKKAKDDLEKKRLDLELDRELEATFPASDALKITRRNPAARSKSRSVEDKKS